MSIYNDKSLKSVADAVAKIMQNEELKGDQHKIDANKNGKVDAHDFKLLRAKKGVKEETEQLDEVGDTPAGRKALGSYVTKAIADKSKDHAKGLRKATSRMYKDDYYGKKTNEEVDATEQEQLNEAFPTVADAQKRHEQSKSDFEKKKISTGTVYSRKEKPDTEEKPKKKMSEMINMYNQVGLKAIAEVKMQEIQVVNADLANGYEEAFVEEASSEEFKKELEDEKAKADGKKKQPDVAKASVQAVKNEEVELDEKKGYGESDPLANRADYAKRHGTGQVYKKTHAGDKTGMTQAYAYALRRTGPKGKLPEEVELEERELTASEKDKKEENVKGMKKGLSGFKERYGKDAKSVMYATATKMAKGE
jgi:hypothetical protein